MKKTLFTAILAIACAAAASATVTKTQQLSTNPGTTGNSNNTAMKAATVYGLEVGQWKGTWENVSLKNQVGFSDTGLNLQIGAASSGVGNFAGLHFELAGFTAGPASLSFTMVRTSTWGGSFNNFDSTYTCTVYGYDSTGASTELGTWSLAKAEEITTEQNVSIDVSVPAAADFTSFGLLFNAKETTSLGSGAGVGMTISNLNLSYTAPLTETTVVNACYDATEGRVTFQVKDDLTGFVGVDVKRPLDVQVGDAVLKALVESAGVAAYDNVKISLTDGDLPQPGVAAASAGDPHTIVLDNYAGTVTFNGSYVGEGAIGDKTYKLAYIPEPATATLSLLALAGLAARRRRK